MTLKTTLRISSKLIRTQFILALFVLIIKSSVSRDFGVVSETKVTRGNDRPILTSHGVRHLDKRNDFFARVKKFYKFLVTRPLNSSERTKPKLVIPAQGGIVHIKPPVMLPKRKRRYRKNAPVESTTRDSVTIPGKVRLVHIDEPSYPNYGSTKSATTSPNVLTTVDDTRKYLGNASAQMSGDNNTVSGSSKTNLTVAMLQVGNVEKIVIEKSEVTGNTSARVASENVTQVFSNDTAAVTAEEPVTSIYIGSVSYPFVAAVHRRGRGHLSFDDVLCSGGIVSSLRVVTACSCLYADGCPAPSHTLYSVSVGHRQFAAIQNTATYDVATVKYHPSCVRTAAGLWRANIAILSIAEPGIKFGDGVQPMTLPKLKMGDASTVLAEMSAERRHCRVIGWSSKAPLVDTAIGKLIPLNECANPVCRKNMGCPSRSTVNGFMVEITPNEPSLLSGALLYCSQHVFAVVNTKRDCTTNNVFAACSPEELLYSLRDFDLTPESQKDLLRDDRCLPLKHPRLGNLH